VRQRAIEPVVDRGATIKDVEDVMEALGVQPIEVDLILATDEPVDVACTPPAGDQVRVGRPLTLSGAVVATRGFKRQSRTFTIRHAFAQAGPSTSISADVIRRAGASGCSRPTDRVLRRHYSKP